MNWLLVHAGILRASRQFMLDILHSMLFRSAAMVLEAENLKGMPKLDWGGIGSLFWFTKDGGGAHSRHLFLVDWTACTIASRGVDFSFERLIRVPSSQAT